ncbi:hypothetical protein [Xylocopilactobacillus apicola]|uniref:Uncharacterized protein n=1 Tax=Xylocopilactobacillus apicola TaxID=2932184 RepID=A0AAU9D607_9LACO|nr:hypothetical protein [Xylocopilactobacillus apicola]BDR57821.1 hypothetical protein XA3_02620 [Xylocopilactobacillus apicola]
MKDFELSEEINQAIVDGIQKGYLNYLEERGEKKEKMAVSGAYAWTKGNHIDDQVAKVAEKNDIDFYITKAGNSWEYLQFNLNSGTDKYLLIIKNSVFKKQGPPKNFKNTNYLMQLAEINHSLFKDDEGSFINTPKKVKLELGSAEVKEILDDIPLKRYSRFYIITYTIDKNKLIQSIKLTIPNNENGKLILKEIADLTNYMQTSKYEITLDSVEPIKDELAFDDTMFSGAETEYGFSVAKENTEEQQ